MVYTATCIYVYDIYVSGMMVHNIIYIYIYICYIFILRPLLTLGLSMEILKYEYNLSKKNIKNSKPIYTLVA